MEEKESTALKVISEMGDDNIFFYVAGTLRDVVILHLVRQTPKKMVRLINLKFQPAVRERLLFIEKMRRLWGLDISEENYSNQGGVCSEEYKYQIMLDSFRNHGGKTLLLASGTGEYFFEDKGIIFLRPLCEFSEADVIEYIKEYKLPSCSLDMAKDTLKPNDYSESELTVRLKELGYL